MITQIRKTISKLHFVAPVAMHFLLTSCSNDIVSPQNNIQAGHTVSSAAKVQFSGEELFRGIFFTQGIVSSKVPILSETINSFSNSVKTNTETKAKNAFYNEMVSGISVSDETYLPRLQKAVASGDPFLIRSILQEGGVLLQKVGLASPKYGRYFSQASTVASKIDLSKFDTSTPKGREALATEIKGSSNKAIDAAGPIEIETYVVAVVAIAVYILVVSVVAIRPQGDTVMAEDLANEQLIEQIVTNLSPGYSK